MTAPNGTCLLARVVAGRADWDHAAQLELEPIRLARPNRMPLGRRQQQVADFVTAHIALHGYCPTFREIAQAVGVSSVSTVAWHVKELRRAGVLVQEPGRHRSLRAAAGGGL